MLMISDAALLLDIRVASPSGSSDERVRSVMSARTLTRDPAWRTEQFYVASLALLAIAIHITLRIMGFGKPVTLLPLYIALTAGGFPLLVTLGRHVAAGEFEADLLAGLSIVTSAVVGEYLAGVTIVLMLSGGAALEEYALRRASAVLDALARRAPSTGHKKTATGLIDIPLGQIAIGDTLVILPHELAPVDGLVVDGRGAMDESYLTGEPFEMVKAPGSTVISGAVNGNSAITVQASKLPVDSRYARIMQVMQAAERDRPRMRRIADRLSAWYTPLGILIAAVAWAASGDPRRFLAVLVIATPCPLLLAIPVAILGAISVSARRGIIIKNPSALEHIDRCRTIIFDKTGTLTYGKPVLAEVVCAPGFSRGEVLALAASVEAYSKHPLAGAVLDQASRSGLTLREVRYVSEKPGEGLRGQVADRLVEIVGRKTASERNSPGLIPIDQHGLECFVFVDGRHAALLRFRDEPRRESAHFIRHLGPIHRVNKVILLSGDRESEVSYLARKVGVTETYSGKSPEDKVSIVKEETSNAPTLYVGDGINDAPAMMTATAGVALGLKSDITAEAADAVIMEPSLTKVDELIHIAHRMRSIALQSAVGGILLSSVGMLFAAAGYLPPVAGALTQEAIDLAAVLNALRVSLPFKELADFSFEPAPPPYKAS